MGKPSFLFLRFFFGLWLAFSLAQISALADDGIYLESFDPIQQTQIDGALASIDKFELDRVVLMPDPKTEGAESLKVRWRLLKAATAGDPRLVVPSLEELEAIRDGGQFTRLPLKGKYRPLLDSRARRLPIDEKLVGSEIAVVERGEKLKGRRQYVRVLNSPNQEKEIRADIAMDESLLPPEAAKIVRSERLYNHSGLRGYYGLPAALTRQIDYEQRLNDRVENKGVFASILESDLPHEYYPEQRPTFKIFNVDVPFSEAEVLKTGHAPDGVVIEKNGKKLVRFFIHPQSEKLFKKTLKKYKWRQDYWATPTSSHRSLIVWNPKTREAPFGVKTTLDATIGDNLRHLSRGQVERAAATSALINTLDAEELEKRGILFIDEPLGVYLKGFERGYAIRNLPALPKDIDLIPMFSLYSKPFGSPPPIVEMVKASGMSAQEFAEKIIIAPLMKHAAYLAWEQGMVGEPHEQNLLIELKEGMPTGRVFYRDLAGFILNDKLRAAAGKDMSFLPKGVKVSSLKPEYGKPVENALNYLRLSNFYAMKQALAPYYPEITDTWVDETFREYMRQSIKKYTGVDSTSLVDWRRAYKEHISGEGAKCSSRFAQIVGSKE